MMRHRTRRGLMNQFGGGGAAQTRGDSTMSGTPMLNVCKNCIDLEQQMLVVMKGCLLLKRQRPMMNLLETMDAAWWHGARTK